MKTLLYTGLLLATDFYFNNKVIIQWGRTIMSSSPIETTLPITFQTRGISTSNDIGSAIINTASNSRKTYIKLYGEKFSSSVAFNWLCIGYLIME